MNEWMNWLILISFLPESGEADEKKYGPLQDLEQDGQVLVQDTLVQYMY